MYESICLLVLHFHCLNREIFIEQKNRRNVADHEKEALYCQHEAERGGNVRQKRYTDWRLATGRSR